MEEFPKTLFVVDEMVPGAHLRDYTQLIGKRCLESAVRDNGRENTVAVYQLLEVRKYKKIVTTTAVVERVNQ